MPEKTQLPLVHDDIVERVAVAIEQTMFAPHEFPLGTDLHASYRATARAAIRAMELPSDPRTTNFDYRSMLARYMEMVGDHEGTDYLGPRNRLGYLSPVFSDEEADELFRISDELNDLWEQEK